MQRTEYFHTPGRPRIACSMQGDGELLVFLHGIGGNRNNWNLQLPRFAPQYTSIAWDARGYGSSDDHPPLASFADFADDLAALLGHLDRGPAHVVGLSMGGMIALDLVDRYPGLVASLVLADSAAGFGPSTPEERAAFLDRRLTPLLSGASMADIAPSLIEVLLTRDATPNAVEMVRDSLLRLRPEPYMNALRAFTTTDFTRSVARITQPCLVIAGEQDLVLPLARSEALAASIRGSRLAVIPACGHLSNIECPDAFNEHLAQFLAGLA